MRRPAVPSRVHVLWKNPLVRRTWTARHTLRLIVLSALATALAYLMAMLIGSTTPVLAAGAALFSVHMSVTTSLSDGANRVAGTLLAVGIATIVESTLGVGPLAIGIIVLGVLFVGRALRLGKEGAIGAAATSLFVLALGSNLTTLAIQDRVIDTLLGVTIGILISSLTRALSPEEEAKEALEKLSDDISTLLAELASGVAGGTYEKKDAETWLRRSRELGAGLATTSGLVTEAEVRARWSPKGRSREVQGLKTSLMALEHSCSQVNSIARNLFDAAFDHKDLHVPGHIAQVLGHTSEAFRVHADHLAEETDTQALAIALEAARDSRKDALREVRNIDDTGVWVLSGAILAQVDQMVDGLGGDAPALLVQEDAKRRLGLSLPTMRNGKDK